MTKPKTPDFMQHFLYSDFMDEIISWKMKDSCEYHVEEYKRLDTKHKTFGLTPVMQEEKQDHLEHAKAFKNLYIYFSGDYGYDPLEEDAEVFAKLRAAKEQADE